jgi:hypothetical protein
MNLENTGNGVMSMTFFWSDMTEEDSLL